MKPAMDRPTRTRMEDRAISLEIVDILTSPPKVPAPDPRAKRLSQLVVAAVVLSTLVGVGLRIQVLRNGHSFWIDEAMLALNVQARSFAQLTEPLDWNQGAPIGFLFTVKQISLWIGESETALRLVPCLAGILGLLAFIPLAYRTLTRSAAHQAVMLFSISPYLVGYCAEFKQYESDATVAIVMTLLYTYLRGSSLRVAPWALFALAGLLTPWLSHPGIFVLAAVGSALLLDAWMQRDRVRTGVTLGILSIWAVNFLVLYFGFLRNLGNNNYLLEYWAGQFLPLPPTHPGDLMWMLEHYFLFFQKPGGLSAGAFGLAGIAGLCYLLGVTTMWRQRVLIVLIGPILLALLASGVHKYPFANRLLLFAVPSALLLVAEGTLIIRELLAPYSPMLSWGFVGLVLFSSASESYWLMTKHPLHDENIRAVVEKLSTEVQPGDKVYLFYGAQPGFEYYSKLFPMKGATIIAGSTPQIVRSEGITKKYDPVLFYNDLEPLRGTRRLWVVFAHQQNHEEATVTAYLSAMGKGEVVYRTSAAMLERFDLGDPRPQNR